MSGGILSRVAVSMAAAVAGGTTWLVVEPSARTVVADFVGLEIGATRSAAAEAATSEITSRMTYERHPDAKPSFDCDMAETTIEKMICSDPTIAEADLVLDKVWSALGSEEAISDELRMEQRRWINRRDACLIDNDPRGCVRKVMLERITELSGL